MSKPQPVQFGTLPPTNADVQFGTVPAAAETIPSAPQGTAHATGADPDAADSGAADAGSADTDN
jgi:hypothetical protein